MLKKLSIKNFALIEFLEIDFRSGFSVITGETGAGKSILIGALSIILGSRAGTGILKDISKKSVIKAYFDISEFSLHNFFNLYNIDYKEITIIRRDIYTSGRSRAFINGTPVNLSIIKQISSKLVDIHSQNQNRNLNDFNYQISVIDNYSKLIPLVNRYKKKFSEYKTAKLSLSKIIEKAKKSKADYDYLQYNFDELETAALTNGEQEKLENELQRINHAEEIKYNLSNAYNLMSDENGIVEKLHECILNFNNIKKYLDNTNYLSLRLESTKIEIEDITDEIESKIIDIEDEPERTTIINERLDLIYSLENKHNVQTVDELILKKNNLNLRLNEINSFDDLISKYEKELNIQRNELIKISDKISLKRKKSFPIIEKKIIYLLKRLGIPAANFKILHKKSNDFKAQGKDIIKFLFSANAHSDVKEVSKIASGGEISRLMLSIKSIISNSANLPSIIFDEIDTGISGDIAEKTAAIMKQMAENMQVINITHLPQIAAMSDNHYFVYKIEEHKSTNTKIRLLNKKERINETAKMLSGENITKAAIKNAKELLKR